MTRTLIVMAKAPRVGQGKSRLARDVGSVEAWRINRVMQAHTLREARDVRWRTVIAVAPDRDVHVALPSVWPQDLVRRPQGVGDLGVRLTRAMNGVSGAVAVIGTDCPSLTRTDIARAFDALHGAAVAVGPAIDGGFWILAARRARLVTRAFGGVRWSSAHTLSDFLKRIDAPVAQLRTLRDVDRLDDWRAVQRAP